MRKRMESAIIFNTPLIAFAVIKDRLAKTNEYQIDNSSLMKQLTAENVVIYFQNCIFDRLITTYL
jgi:hypothetical protein